MYLDALSVGLVSESPRIRSDDAESIHKSVTISGLSVYGDYQPTRSLVSFEPTDSSLLPLLSNGEVSAEVAFNLRSVEDRWVSRDELVDHVLPCVAEESRDHLRSFLETNYDGLIDQSLHCSSDQDLIGWLHDRLTTTLSEKELADVALFLFQILKTPTPVTIIDGSISSLSLHVDSQHLLFLSDMISSLPPSEKPSPSPPCSPAPSTSPPTLRFTPLSLAMYVAYHVFSNYTLFATTVFLILTFPLWLFFAFFQTVGGLLCLGSSLLYLNRFLVDKTEATPLRYDPQRTRRDSSLQVNVRAKEVSLGITDSSAAEDMRPIISLRAIAGDGELRVSRADLLLKTTVGAVTLQDLTSPEPCFLLQPVAASESPDPLLSFTFLSVHSSDSFFLLPSSLEAVERDSVCQGKTTLRIALRPLAVDFYQPAIVAAYRVLASYGVSDSSQGGVKESMGVVSESTGDHAADSTGAIAPDSLHDIAPDSMNDITPDSSHAVSNSHISDPSHDSSKSPQEDNKLATPSLAIQVDIASISFVERNDDRSVFASLSLAPIQVMLHRNGHQLDIDVTGASIAVVDDVSVGLHAPDLQVHISSYVADSPHYPGFSSSILVRAPSLQGVLRLPFILAAVRTLLSGSLVSEMSAKETTESVEAVDYSQKPHMDIQVANPCILLASDATGNSGILLRSRKIVLESGERSIVFNTMMVTADGLTVSDEAPILHTSRLGLCLRFCDTSTRVSITLDPSYLILFPPTLTHLMAAISHSFKQSTPSAVEDEEFVLTEVSADDGDFTVHIDPSFILDVTLRGITAYLEQESLQALPTVEAYMEEVRSNAVAEATLTQSSCTYKSSLCDKSVEASIGVLSLIDSSAHSLCADSYRQCASLGNEMEPFVKGQLAILEDGSKLFCSARVGPTVFHLTPALLSIPVTFTHYLPQKSATESGSVEESSSPVVCRRWSCLS